MSESAAEAKRSWNAGQKKATALMYPAYAAAIFGRTSIDAALPAMILDPANAFTAADTATLLSTGVMFYSLGKLFGGAAADKLGGAATFAFTMLNSGLQIFLISISSNINAMALFWGLARLGGGSFWPAMNKVAASWWDETQFGEAWSILTTSSRMGAIVGGLAAGVLLRMSSWRTLLRVGAASSLLTGGAMALFLKSGPVQQKVNEKKQEGSYVGNLLKICAFPRVLLTYGTQGMMLPLNELNSLIPLFLVQNAAVSTATASSIATAYPMGAILSMLLSGKVFDRLSDSARLKLFGLQNLMALCGLQVLSMRPSSVPVIAASLVVVMTGVAPTIFLAPSGLLRRYASSQYNGSMIGLADVPGYLTSMVFLKLYPKMLERGGWALPMRVMQGAVVLGGLMNAWVWKLEASDPTTEPVA